MQMERPAACRVEADGERVDTPRRRHARLCDVIIEPQTDGRRPPRRDPTDHMDRLIESDRLVIAVNGHLHGVKLGAPGTGRGAPASKKGTVGPLGPLTPPGPTARTKAM